MQTTTLNLYNTTSRSIEEFAASDDKKVRIYTCGPTVYDYPHIGNWVAYIYWDTLVRALRTEGYAVERVMNITDVGHLISDEDEGEDKLEKGARREGKTAWEVAEFYTEDFMAGMKKLGLIMPEHIARATDYIEQQLALVRALKDKGYTYQISDGIYFDTSKFPRYGDFARLNTDELRAGARVEFNPEKRSASDFALWKFTPPGVTRDMQWETPADLLEADKRVAASGAAPASREIFDSREAGVDSPTGRASSDLHANSEGTRNDGSGKDGVAMGFPGWHLECSAIAMYFLGSTLDIHTGGIDHIPVHHTNEIAQSEAATGHIFSRFWLHNNHMKVEGSKISKSLGNGYTLQDIEARGFDPLDFRLLVLQSHYQSEANFSFEALEAAKNRLNHWRAVAALRWQVGVGVASELESLLEDAEKNILRALEDNINTPEALRLIDENFSRIEAAPLSALSRRSVLSLLVTIDNLIGLELLTSTPDIDEGTKQLIARREAARSNKDWTESDKLRDQLTARGIAVKDTPEGSVWSRTSEL